METREVTHFSFTIPEVENEINKLKVSLTDYSETQGRHDGKRKEEIQKAAFNVIVLDYVKSRGQETIDYLKQAALVGAQILNVRELEESAAQTCHQLERHSEELEHKLVALEREKKSWTPNYSRTTLLWIVAIFVGIADSTFAYEAFRNTFSTINSVIASLAIAAVISITHVAYVPWVMKSPQRIKRYLKKGIVLLIAFIFFYWIAVLRSSALNSAINLDVSLNSTEPNTNLHHVTPWLLCVISMVLFIAVFLLSFWAFKTAEEQEKDRAHKKTCGDIAKVKNEIADRKTDIDNIKSRIIQEKRHARLIYDYVVKSIHRIKNICFAGISLYKQAYARQHSTAPSFFSDPTNIMFDENFQLFQPQNQEQ